MKRNLVVLLFVLLLPLVLVAENRFYLNLREVTLLCPDIQGFEVEDTDGGSWYSDEASSVEITGNSGIGLAIAPGAAIDTQFMRINVSAGLGYMFFAAFGTSTVSGELELLFKNGERFLIGPRAAILFYSPSWIVDGDVSLSSYDPGFQFGLGMYGSFTKLDVGGSLNYQTGAFGVKTDNGWVASDDELNISGVALQIGIRFKTQ